MVGGPVGEVGEERRQAAAELTDLVLHPGGHLGVIGAHHEPVPLHLPQALGEHLRRDGADVALQDDEALASEGVERPQDRRRPPAEDDVEHRGDRACLRRGRAVCGGTPDACHGGAAGGHANPPGSHFPLGTYFTQDASFLEDVTEHRRRHRQSAMPFSPRHRAPPRLHRLRAPPGTHRLHPVHRLHPLSPSRPLIRSAFP